MTDFTQIVNGIEKSKFQQAIDLVESLPLDDREMLIDIIQKRLHQQRRKQLVQEVEAAEADYAQGNFHRGTIADWMAEQTRCISRRSRSQFAIPCGCFNYASR